MTYPNYRYFRLTYHKNPNHKEDAAYGAQPSGTPDGHQ